MYPSGTQDPDDIDPNSSQHNLHTYATPIQPRPYLTSEGQMATSNALEGMVYHWPPQPPPCTGDAREIESLRAQLRQYQQQHHRQQKRDRDITYLDDEMSPMDASSNPSPVSFSQMIPEDPMACTSDFVRKLYRFATSPFLTWFIYQRNFSFS